MTGPLWQRCMVQTGAVCTSAQGVLTPVPAGSRLYRMKAAAEINRTQKTLVRFFGVTHGFEDGVSQLRCGTKMYLVLQSRVLTVGNRGIIDAILQEVCL